MHQFPNIIHTAPLPSNEYERLTEDFKINGENWTTQQLKHYFNIGYLEVCIYDLTSFCFDLDYKNPTIEQNSQQQVKKVLTSLWGIIQKFRIPIPPPDNNQITNSFIPLAESLAKAAEWAEDVIRPLLDKLKRCEILSSLGVEYERLDSRKTKLIADNRACIDFSEKQRIEAEFICTVRKILILQKSINDIVRQYIEDIKEFISSKEKPRNLVQIKIEIIYLFPKVRNANSVAPQLIEKSIPTDKSSTPYQPEKMLLLRIKSKCGFEILAYGAIFLAQQELDQPQDQQPVLSKLATLISDITKPALATMIREFGFTRNDFLYNLDGNAATHHSGTHSLVNILAKIFRQSLAKHQLTNLITHLKNDDSPMNDPIWLDCVREFWHFYDNSPLTHNSYFSFDKTITQNISDTAEHIKRLERASGETYIEKNGRPVQLKAAGFWRVIAQMMVTIYINQLQTTQGIFLLYNEMFSSHKNINESLFDYGYYLFQNLRIADLETLFLEYYTHTVGSDHLSINRIISGIRANSDFVGFSYIEDAANTIKKLPPEKRNALVNHSYERKSCTPQMLRLLRAYFATDPRFGVARRSRHHDIPQPEQSVPARMLQHFPSLFANNSDKTNNKNVELKPLNSGYGTFAASSQSSSTSSSILDEDAVLRYQATEEDIIILAEQFLDIRVIFHNKSQGEQPKRVNVERPVLHLYAFNATEMCLYIDPFPKTVSIIPQDIAAPAMFIRTAHLTKEEICELYSLAILFGTRLMINICKMCQEENISVTDVLNYIKTNMRAIKRSSNVYFVNSIDYIFYRFYGKSYEEVVATLNVSVVIQEAEQESQQNRLQP